MSVDRTSLPSDSSMETGTFAASKSISSRTNRSRALRLPGAPHKVQMKRFHGVEVLLVHLDGEQDPYCSLRHLEMTLLKPDLLAFMESLGMKLRTRTLDDTGFLSDIINLRTGVLETEPTLIKLRAVECILHRIGLARCTPHAGMKVEKIEESSIGKTEERAHWKDRWSSETVRPSSQGTALQN